MAPLTLYHLQDSRSFRCVWLIQELGISCEIIYAKRENNKAPANFKSAHQMGKSPLLLLEDEETTLIESPAICEYLLEAHATPDQRNRFMGGGSPVQAGQVRAWVSFAEGTLMTHAIPITYSRWFMPEGHRKALPELEKALSNNVKLDLQYVEDTLAKSTSGFLVGEDLTLADIVLAFSVHFVLVRELGVKWTDEGLPHVKSWIRKLQGRPAWQKATQQGEDSYTLDAVTK